MKQSPCCGVPEGQARAYQMLATHRAEPGAHHAAAEQPCPQNQELRADCSSCCPWAGQPACLAFITVKSAQANFSGAAFRGENEGLSAREDRRTLRHPPGQGLLDAILMRKDKP